MISRFEKRRHNSPYRFDGLRPVGVRTRCVSIVQADDRAATGTREDALGNFARAQLPVEPDDAPHDTGESKPRLHFTEAEPADSIWRPQQGWRAGGHFRDGVLRAVEFTGDERRTRKCEIRVRVRMVGNLVRSRADSTSQVGSAFDVAAALKKSRRDLVLREDLQNRGGGEGRPVIEGKRDGFLVWIAVPDGRSEHL